MQLFKTRASNKLKFFLSAGKGAAEQQLSFTNGETIRLPERDPIKFAKNEWPGFDWLSPEEDRGHFMQTLAKEPKDSLVIGAKETAKSLTFSLMAIYFMLNTRYKTHGIIAGSEDQAKVTYAHLRRLLLSGKHTRSMLNGEPRAVEASLVNGAKVWIYAASYYRAHGRHPDVLWADEAVLGSSAAKGEVLKGALESVTSGGFRVMGSAPYYYDSVFMPTWKEAEERGWQRFGPWRKHPWEELKEPFETPVNRRPWLDLEVQVNEAKRAMQNPLSNYRVFWLGELQAGVGDVFKPEQVDAILAEYDYHPISGCKKSLGVDTGFGSSQFGIVGLEQRDDTIYVTIAEQYERPNFNEMARAIAQAVLDDGYESCYVDASNPSFIEALKRLGVQVTPVVWARELPTMISSTQMAIEIKQIRIHRGFPDLIFQLKNARWAPNGRKILKTAENSFDLGDAFMAALTRWREREPAPAASSSRRSDRFGR